MLSINSCRKTNGFTLIELLVVIVILSLFTSSVFFSINSNPDKEVKSEFNRLAQIIKLAQDEAMLKGEMFGLHLYENGYFFSRYHEEQWQIIRDDKLLNPYSLPEGLILALEIEDEFVALKFHDKNIAIELKENEQPPIYFLSSGEMSAFKIMIKNKHTEINDQIKAEIKGYETGQLNINYFQAEQQ
ncbi:MAG: type II secretion system minor pseudopilin GspH [Gammaproteobacteria bacterium]|nr:type II secretion system minor pseudopilin GspH [Gammaproteobacteria bacterium]